MMKNYNNLQVIGLSITVAATGLLAGFIVMLGIIAVMT